MKFSVILPINRFHEHVDEAVNSVLSQSLTEFELLLIVNGSEVDLSTTLRSRYSFDSRVKVIVTKFFGLPFALNFGIQNSQADLIVRMDSDDICDRNRLKMLWFQFEADAKVQVVASCYRELNSKGFLSHEVRKLPLSNAAIRWHLPFRCVIAHPTVAIRKDLLLSHGGYMAGWFSEDYDLWLRLRRDLNVVFVILPDPLLHYRIHSGQMTSAKNWLNYFAHDISLKLRELILTRDPIFLLALPYTIARYMWRGIVILFNKST